MIKNLLGNVRLYFASAWYSYRGLYAVAKFCALYIGQGRFSPCTDAALYLYGTSGRFERSALHSDRKYTVIARHKRRIRRIHDHQRRTGFQNTALFDRQPRRAWTSLPWSLARTHHRRIAIHGCSFVPGCVLLPRGSGHANLGLTMLCILLLSFTACGMGLILGSLSLRTREAWTITSMVVIVLYIFSGVNFPVDILPKSLQAISYSLPLTRGIQAARLAMSGGNWSLIQSLFLGELWIGLIYIGIGYFLFSWFEKLSLVDGQIEAM